MTTLSNHIARAKKTNPHIGVSVKQGRFNICDTRLGPSGGLVTTRIEGDLSGPRLVDRLGYYATHAYPQPLVS